MLNTTFSPWPSFTDREIQAVAAVLASNRVNYWTGEECRKFEGEFAEWTGAAYAVALANGTLALDAALRALDIGVGDEVVVTPRTFIASASAIVNAGARPVFADVDLDSGNLTAETVARVITPRSKAIMCVHLAGWPCDMDPIVALARLHKLKVIEDCAQAHGARYKGRSVGTLGDIGAWSFCQDKIMTTGGEGGMVTTNDRALWSRVWSLKDHGKTWESMFERLHPPGYRWVHDQFGTNWRMIEIQAAIGREQLTVMPEWTARRTRLAAQVWDTCREIPGLRVPAFRCSSGTCGGACAAAVGCVHAHYKCYVYVRPELLNEGWTRDRIIAAINAAGVPCYSGSCSEVYLEKAFDGTGWRPAERLPNAKLLGETSLMFLVHPTLKDSEMDLTCDTIRAVMARASN